MILRFLGENMVPELRFLFLFGPVVGSMTFKGHFFRPFFMLTRWGLKSWTYRALDRKLVGKWRKTWGNFLVVSQRHGEFWTSSTQCQGPRQWKRSIPSRNARQVGGWDGFMGSSSRNPLDICCCIGFRCPCLWSCLGCYGLWGWRVGGFVDTTLTVVTPWNPIYGETTRPYCPGWNLASPAQKRCSAFFFNGGEMLGGNRMWGNLWREWGKWGYEKMGSYWLNLIDIYWSMLRAFCLTMSWGGVRKERICDTRRGENRVEIHIWSIECNMKVLMSLSLEEFGAKEVLCCFVEFNISFQDPRKTGIKAKLDKHVRQRTILRVQNWIFSINT